MVYPMGFNNYGYNLPYQQNYMQNPYGMPSQYDYNFGNNPFMNGTTMPTGAPGSLQMPHADTVSFKGRDEQPEEKSHTALIVGGIALAGILGFVFRKKIPGLPKLFKKTEQAAKAGEEAASKTVGKAETAVADATKAAEAAEASASPAVVQPVEVTTQGVVKSIEKQEKELAKLKEELDEMMKKGLQSNQRSQLEKEIAKLQAEINTAKTATPAAI